MRASEENRINLSRLGLGQHVYDLVLNDDFFHALESTEVLGGEVHVQATLNLRATDYDLLLMMKGEVEVTCDRCLEPMTIVVEDEQTFYSPDEDHESLDEDGILDIQWLAYETIIVNLPLVHSHQPGGCSPEMDALLQSHLCAEPEPES